MKEKKIGRPEEFKYEFLVSIHSDSLKRSLVVDERSPLLRLIHAQVLNTTVRDLWTIGRHSVILTDTANDALAYAFLV
jgi:hypothetical protein